jgi:hypothetical protein
VIEAIKIGLPNIGVYMDGRICDSLYLPSSNQYDLKNVETYSAKMFQL